MEKLSYLYKAHFKKVRAWLHEYLGQRVTCVYELVCISFPCKYSLLMDYSAFVMNYHTLLNGILISFSNCSAEDVEFDPM